MKYDQESEEVDFPGYSMQRNDPKSYNNDDEPTSSKKKWIILAIVGVIIIAGLVVFLILFIKQKRSQRMVDIYFLNILLNLIKVLLFLIQYMSN